MNDVNAPIVVNTLGFDMYIYAPSQRKTKGILLMWRRGVDVKPIYVSFNIFSLLVYSNPPHKPWLLNFIYCPAQYNEKMHFWTLLNDITLAYLGPILRRF